jgi:hypothetical protein
MFPLAVVIVAFYLFFEASDFLFIQRELAIPRKAWPSLSNWNSLTQRLSILALTPRLRAASAFE